jgi:Glycosyl transferases group 1
MRVLLMTSAKPVAWSRHFIRAFRRCGHELIVLSDIAADGIDVLERGAVDITQVCNRIGFQPDFFINIEGGSGLFLPIGLENLECPTAWYAVDSHLDWHKHLATARVHDVVFVAHKEYVALFRANGVCNAEWLPVAAMGAGAVLLTNKIYNDGVEELFTPGSDLVQYTTTDELLNSYRRLINDPVRIAEIGARAQALILAKHTYDHRVATIVERMARAPKVLKPRAYDYFAMFVTHNMLPEALSEVSKEMAMMGLGSRRRPLNLLARAGISTLNVPLSLATRLMRRVH